LRKGGCIGCDLRLAFGDNMEKVKAKLPIIVACQFLSAFAANASTFNVDIDQLETMSL
jgi:hypothetical protein